jgi:alkylation response protein AidB-like acyl-CoA dehydrogenase
MTSPGITVEPIKQASGHFDFNEVFFTDVFVPDDMLVGAPGAGWDLAVATMAVERTAIGNYVNIDRSSALRHVASAVGPDQDAALRALGDVEACTTAIKALVLRASTATLGMAGRVAMLEESDPAVVRPYFDMPSELIGGGTAEIQLTVIASMILGLPRS